MRDEKQHSLYAQAGDQFAGPIARLARAMERDPDKARDLEQDIHCELFRSFARFDGRCSLKTWVYRISHNVAAEHRLRASRGPKPVSLETIDALPEPASVELAAAESHAIAQAQALIRSLPTLDAQVMLLWLEGESAGDIADVTGLSSQAVATRVHRLKALIADHFTPPQGSKNP